MILVGTIRQLDLDKREGRMEGHDGERKTSVQFRYNAAPIAVKVRKYFVEDTRVVVTFGNGWLNSIEPVGTPNNPLYDRLYDACCTLVREAVKHPDDTQHRIVAIGNILKQIEEERI